MSGGHGRDADVWIITVYSTDAAYRRRQAHKDLLCSRGFAVI